MRFYTVTLAANDTPATLKSLIETSLAAAADSTELALFSNRKYKNIAYIVIYPEDGNNIDATNGPARIGKGYGLTGVDRVIADAGATDDAVANGFPLLPGILNTTLFQPIGGAMGVYSTEAIYLTGATGDVFQIGIVTI